jgi:hypothetical protein
MHWAKKLFANMAITESAQKSAKAELNFLRKTIEEKKPIK